MANGKLKVKDAAKLLGTTESTIRKGILEGWLDIGVAYKRNPNGKNYSFIIYPKKLNEYVECMGLTKGQES